MKNFYFVQREEYKEYELWVEGNLITDCFTEEEEDLINQLVYFANVPIYKDITEDIVKEGERKGWKK